MDSTDRDEVSSSSKDAVTTSAEGLYAPSKVTETLEVTVTASRSGAGSGNAGATAAAVIVPLLIIAALALILYMWHRRRSRAGKSALIQHRWRADDVGGPSSPQSAELALKMDEKKEIPAVDHKHAGIGIASLLPVLSPDRKARHAGGTRTEDPRRKRDRARRRSISPPFDMQHKASGPTDLVKSSTKRSLANQLAAAELAQSRAQVTHVLFPPSYDSLTGGVKGGSAKAAKKRQKPAPLDLSRAVSAGTVMSRQKHRNRALEGRKDVPRALQPRVRSLRRKPVPVAPLPKAPHEAVEQLHASSEKSESPLDRPLSRQSSSHSAGTRPLSTSTFFCKGSEGVVPPQPIEEASHSTQSPARRSAARSVNSLLRQSRFSTSTFLTAKPNPRCPPNSLAGSALTVRDEKNERGNLPHRRSARASMADKLRGSKAEDSGQ